MKKGFTLIELLAVIVILAIIALIATPIILGIINNTKKESDKRSVELYVKAAELAVARKNLKGEFKPTTCEVTGGVCMCEGYTDPLNVEMDNASNINGKITFNDKGVITSNTLEVGHRETTEDPTPEEPEYYLYQWYIGSYKEGPTIGNSINLANYTEANGFLYSTTAPEDKEWYNKLKIEDNVVTEGYSCVILEREEHCLKGVDKDGNSFYGDETYGNLEYLKTIESADERRCVPYSGNFRCTIPGDFKLMAGPFGYVYVEYYRDDDYYGFCDIGEDGLSQCGTE